MTTASQSDFAALMGVNKGTVSRWKKAGRLVMLSGLVDVEASQRRLAETSGGRDDVADRHAEQRGAALPMAEQKVGAGGTAILRNESRADAQARKESNQADILELELKKLRGTLIEKEASDSANRSGWASIRARLERLPDQLAPLTTPSTDYDENHALIAEAVREILSGVAEDVRHIEGELKAIK
jgi:hypothetical protein